MSEGEFVNMRPHIDHKTDWSVANLVLPAVVRVCGLLAVAILVAAAGGLTWFVLTQWLSAVKAAHRDVLGLDR